MEKETITVIYEKGQCSIASLNKRQFETEPLPMVHIIARNCKEKYKDKVIAEVLTYLQKEIGRELKHCGSGSGFGDIINGNGFEVKVQIAYH
ncbi:MAG: hypothetical protein K2I90_01235 [Odoribacter sp.]|nr:hypothetical protein [Odoribacter sp.]